MSQHAKIELDQIMQLVEQRSPGQPEFHQATHEFFQDVLPVINSTPGYRAGKIHERLIEPDRVISFRVVWQDDDGAVQVNRGWRVQFSNAIGPYKGGLRFHPTVTESVLKFLGFEQMFKNALTGLPMGGGKGGSDFDPKGRSESEIMRFCQAFMMELSHHIGPDVDVPAGDINVGEREIGYLFGAHKRIAKRFEGVLTGKGPRFGGSELRTEATGYGLIIFVQRMLSQHDKELDGQRVVISGAGNVATHAAEKAAGSGAKVLTLSDSGGFILDEEGISDEKIKWVREHKRQGGSLKEYADEFEAKWHADASPWEVECDVALPCATQNELDDDGVRALIENGCIAIAEGANMPVTADGKKVLDDSDLLFAPGKASNAGGVAISGLEISQNRMRRSLTREELDEQLCLIMHRIHDSCVEHGEADGVIDYAKGANISSFTKMAETILAEGVV